MIVDFKSNIILGFVLVAFIDEVEDLGVVLVLLQARHRSLRSLSYIVDLELPPQAIINNGWRMEVRKGSDNVIFRPHRIAKRLGVVLKKLSFICALFIEFFSSFASAPVIFSLGVPTMFIFQ